MSKRTSNVAQSILIIDHRQPLLKIFFCLEKGGYNENGSYGIIRNYLQALIIYRNIAIHSYGTY